jgi:hypothetical protein
VIDLKRLRDDPEYRRGIERKRVRADLVEEVLALPGQHGGVDVRGPREHAGVAEGLQRGLDLLHGERRGRTIHQLLLTDALERRVRHSRRARRWSAMTARAACQPGMPQTPPPNVPNALRMPST